MEDEEVKQTMYLVLRGDKVMMCLPLDEHADGTLWSRDMPLLDARAEGFTAIGKERMAELVRAKRYAEIPAACFARMGVNPSGLRVVSQAEHRAQALAARTPAQVERDRINGLYAEAYVRRDAMDDNNTSDYYRIKGTADVALTAWRETYAAEAREEDARKMDGDAAHQEQLAAGALTYDADGWLDEAARQQRHDEMMAHAAKLREQAATLRAER